ncbi:hypothetical protein FCU94_06085 [Vibrio sp. JPW-9-11-11]|uniref:aldose epimerase family protein n=1 Tax=Vibrio sp. JPW-9-11-11 TaxID=1416532 RepID=UPI001593A0C8|nr:hypothetical protein [Vibrio sp. JPW-9-11-11]NVD06477.1 hypothetical protein [Vibrio sp. JPW-9-11-11]
MNSVKISNAKGSVATLLDYGATLTSLKIAFDASKRHQVVLGYPSARDYLYNPVYMGSTVGPFAGRIPFGTIRSGSLCINAPCNEQYSMLHGGQWRLSHRYWKLSELLTNSATFLWHGEAYQKELRCHLEARVHYLLTDDNALNVEISALPSQPAPLSFTHHSYFNLDPVQHSVTKHKLRINSHEFWPVNDKGWAQQQQRVVNSGLNFIRSRELNLDTWGCRHLKSASGLDHSFLLDSEKTTTQAELVSSDGQRMLEVMTNQPALHVYSGNFVGGQVSRLGHLYQNRAGICFEAQHRPVEHSSDGCVPSKHCWYHPAKPYFSQTTYRFSSKAHDTNRG